MGWIFSALGLVLVVVVVIWVRRRSGPRVQAYSDLRRGMIGAIGSLEDLRGEPPERPANLDMRLPKESRVQLERAWANDPESREVFALFVAVGRSIEKELETIDRNEYWYELLSPERRAIILVDELDREVNNGGFDQYYLNSSGDGAALCPDSLRLLGLNEVAELVERANAVFPDGPVPDRGLRMSAMETLEGTWKDLDREFYHEETNHSDNTRTGGYAISAGVPFILKHPDQFFKD